MSSNHIITFAMSSVNNEETRTRGVCDTINFITKHNTNPFCDNVIHSDEDKSSNKIKKKNEKYISLINEHAKSIIVNKNSHITFPYLSHLVTFSWQRRKRRLLDNNKKCENNSLIGVTHFLFMLMFLVLSSNYLAPINATAASMPKGVSLWSYIPSLDVSSHMPISHYLVKSSDDAKSRASSLFEADAQKDKPSNSVLKASRSRKARGKKF